MSLPCNALRDGVMNFPRDVQPRPKLHDVIAFFFYETFAQYALLEFQPCYPG